jgi:hypothetical protein
MLVMTRVLVFDSDGSVHNETIYFLVIWTVLTIINLVSTVFWTPSIATFIFLLLATAANVVAAWRCQPMINSRALGGNGVVHMILVVPNSVRRHPWRHWFASVGFRHDGRVRLPMS